MDNNVNINGDGGSGGGAIVIFLFIFLLIAGTLIFMFFYLKKKNGSPGPSSSLQTTFSIGGYTFTGTSPGPSPSPGSPQANASVPLDAHTQTTLLSILNNVPNMIISGQTLTFIVADLVLKGPNSFVFTTLKSIATKIYKLGNVTGRVAQSVSKSIANTAKSLLTRAAIGADAIALSRAGIMLEKTAADEGIDMSARVVADAARLGITLDITAARAAIAGAVEGLATAAGGFLFDPLVIATAIGIALDQTDAGGYMKLAQTSDLLVERKTSLSKNMNTIKDCMSWPLGPSCPPSSSPAPPSSSPAPPPSQGRYPAFVGPLDLIDPSVIAASVMTDFYSMLTDPGDPNGGFKKTIDLLSGPVQQSLLSLYNSVRTPDDGGTVNPIYTPFIWASTQAQQFIQQAIDVTQGDTSLAVATCRLKILLAGQQLSASYIVWLVNNGVIAESNDITQADWTALCLSAFPASLLDEFSQIHRNVICTDNGGVIFNPGNGYDQNTCTWATKEDCHGAYPWYLQNGTLQDPPTARTTDLLCRTTCPAPCPSGTPAPSCPPPVPCPASSPCPATTDPSKADLLYTEWRDPSWFTNSGRIAPLTDGTAWNAGLDQSALNRLPGMCIIGDPAMHSGCDLNVIVNDQTASQTNSYDRTTGTCVNTGPVCDVYGVSYNPSMNASDLGPGDVEGANYPSCYTNTTDQISGYILGTTWMRFYNSGGSTHIDVNNSFGNSSAGHTAANVLNPITLIPGGAQAENQVVNTVATYGADISAATVQYTVEGFQYYAQLGSSVGNQIANGFCEVFDC